MKLISFNVVGIPRPKQSFKISHGRGYTPKLTSEWVQTVQDEACLAMRGLDPLSEELVVTIDFYLPDRRRRDLDNLSKAVLDACNGIVYQDDQQIVELHLTKSYGSKEYGITFTVELKI